MEGEDHKRPSKQTFAPYVTYIISQLPYHFRQFAEKENPLKAARNLITAKKFRHFRQFTYYRKSPEAALFAVILCASCHQFLALNSGKQSHENQIGVAAKIF